MTKFTQNYLHYLFILGVDKIGKDDILDFMSRCLKYRFLPVIMGLWVIVFSVLAPMGLVVCVGENDHLALEMSHHDHFEFPIDLHSQSVSGEDCGDCSDTPVLSYFGRVRSSSILDFFRRITVPIGCNSLPAPTVDSGIYSGEAVVSIADDLSTLKSLSSTVLRC